MMGDFNTDGFQMFGPDAQLMDWVHHASVAGRNAMRDADLQKQWLRFDGTWFVGVDVLGNDANGVVAGSEPLQGQGAAFCKSLCESWAGWGDGQVSVCFKGYPRQDETETEANHNYRVKRDSAHLDGLKPVGPQRRRHMDEFHSFVFGIALNNVATGSAPFVVWRGSHVILQNMLIDCFAEHPHEEWEHIDITERYTETRREIFETCERVELPIKMGESYVVNRFALHGVAPWTATDNQADDHRMIAYFRPYWQGEMANWLHG